jgi:Tol biopolymer transport system component
MTMLRKLLLLLVLTGFGRPLAWGQVAFYDFTQRQLEWYTLETGHFRIHFHLDARNEGPSRTAQVVARIAEDIYGPITELYQHTPDTKVSIILKDYQDYSNGAAYFFDNMIEIWVPALDTPLRGDHNWLRNVITHEFTHIVQVQKTMKANRRVPFFYFQFLDYEDVKRPDVLYGYPNVIATYPLPILNNPAWLAEGTAQFQRAALDYDQWDAHRDMLLRTRVLAGEEMTLADMGGFYSHTSLLREGVYNHGFAFTRYLARTYGEDALRTLSEQLGRWGNWNFERAAKDALGRSGSYVYTEWMTTLRQGYQEQSAAVRARLVEGTLVEPEGFSNAYPRFSPDGARLAYLSNKGQDFNRTALYVLDLATGTKTTQVLEGLDAGERLVHTCAFGHRITAGTTGAFAWRPDGQALLYARIRDTKDGYLFSDLYELDLQTKQERRLTHDLRAAAPAYRPDGQQVAFIGQADGSTNLYLFDPATTHVTPLTTFTDGTQVTDPRWHPSGQWLAFARMREAGRDLWRINADGTGLAPLLATAADERSPAFDARGEHLYFASDANGIFNLYRLPLDPSTARLPVPLTNVLGGAFMPDVGPNGQVAFAQYQWDGYKVALLEAPQPLDPLPTYAAPAVTQKVRTDVLALNQYDDTDLTPLPTATLQTLRQEDAVLLNPGGADGQGQVEAYKNVFTAFSFYPVVRLDQYIERRRSLAEVRVPDRTRGETLWRNTKAGFYTSSREVLNGLSFFGGLLLSLASRPANSVEDFLAPTNLLKLERDLFVQFEYRKGLGLIPHRWSPQFSLELFNIRRNVENGLTIEEFPCTACFPDTTLADLAYNLWELNLTVRSKVNRNLLLEAGYRYSPYRVTTERFFSKELDQSISPSSQRYFIGRAFRAKASFEALKPHRHDDVVPNGLRAELGLDWERGRLLDRFNIEDGLLVPVYEQDQSLRLTLDLRYYRRLPGRPLQGTHGLGLRLRGSSILGSNVDDFYDDYVGGLIGARGYPFYALGGNETLWLQAAYHFPLAPRIHRQVAFAYVDKLYGRVYADAAAASRTGYRGLDTFRKDVGAELRLGLGSFYLLPTAVFVSATYGLDAFDFQLDEGFVTPSGDTFVRYGNELLWHVGILFGFDL